MLKRNTASQNGFTIIELLVVIAMFGVLTLMITTTFRGSQARGRDEVRKNDIESIYRKLEDYHAKNGFYPASDVSADMFPDLNPEVFKDSDGVSVVSSFNASEPSAPKLTTTNEYLYVAYGDGSEESCKKDSEKGCTHFKLYTFLEREEQYEKAGTK